MQSLKRYGTETQYSTALTNNQFVNNQVTLTDDDGYVHFLFQNYQFNVTIDDENDGTPLYIEEFPNCTLYMQDGSTLADFTDTEFDVLKCGGKRPTFTFVVDNVPYVYTIVETRYYDTDWTPRFWDYQFCVDEFFNYTSFYRSGIQPLKFIYDEGYTEMLEVVLDDETVLTFFRKPTSGGDHTKIIMFDRDVEFMWMDMIVCPTTNPAYSAIKAKHSHDSTYGFSGRELGNVSNSLFSQMTGLKNATNFDVFRYFTGVTTIPSANNANSAFFNNSPMTHIVFPKSLTTIGNRAFYYAEQLTDLKLPKSLKSLGTYSFQYCSSISGEVIVPYGVATLRSYTFSRCSGITKLVLKGPKTVQTYAAEYCTSLREVVFSQKFTTLQTNSFRYCSALERITSFAKTTPTVGSSTFRNVKSNGVLYRPAGSNYTTWMQTGNYYLGKYGWTQQDIPEGTQIIF